MIASSGPSSVYLASLFQRMGIADAIKSKTIQIGPGLPVGKAVANGEGEIGFTQVSELLAADGIDLIPSGLRWAGDGHALYFETGVKGTSQLYRVDLAAPKRTATPAQLRGLENAMTQRRTCTTCGQIKPYVIPRRFGECLDCTQTFQQAKESAA